MHKWEVDPAEVASAGADLASRFNADNICPIGLALLEGGALAVTFHARNSFPCQVGIAEVGHTAAQYGPQFLLDGTVVVFDNLGVLRAGSGGARIARIDLRSGAAETVYPRSGTAPAIQLRSQDGGHISVSPEGSLIMVSSKDQSRSFEVDVATGVPLWFIDITYDIAPYLALKNARSDGNRARFNAYRVYYLTGEDLAFLAK